MNAPFPHAPLTSLDAAAPYDVARLREDFPALGLTVNGHPLTYLDNAASAQKPRAVLERMTRAYETEYGNVHRGLHHLANAATEAYEGARETVRGFLNAASADEIVFTKNATEAYNLVAYSFGNASAGSPFALGPGDEVCVTEMEHHSNLVPWQMLCERTGATLRWIPLTDDGRLDLTDLDSLVNERTKVLAFVHVSNILGTRNPVDVLVARARAVGAYVLVDGAQSAPHEAVDVQALGADFFVLTGHKMLGPSGVGVLWGRRELLDAMPPFLGGGSMIETVQMSGSTYAAAPERFEAGTPVISQAVEPKTKADQEKMGVALGRLAQEDPSFRVKTDEESGQTIISGMGELHLEIIVDRMKREFGVEANVGKPQVAYRETIRKAVADVEGKFVRQSGGKGQYGHVVLKIEPQEPGKGFEFVDAIKGGVVPREFIPAVRKGVEDSLPAGVLAGYPVVDVKVTLTFGSYHEVDSNENAFKMAASFGFKDGCRKASPVILEPMMAVEVETPEDYAGGVMGDLSSRRGMVQGMDDMPGGGKVIKAEVPLSEMFGYSTTLRSMSQGRATYTMEFKHYSEAPKNVADAIITARGK